MRPILQHSFPTRRAADLQRQTERRDRTVAGGARHADRAVPGRKQHIRPDSSEQRNLEQRLAKLDPALRPEDALEPRQRIDARRFGRPQPGVELERTEARLAGRSEEHTSELQSLMRISYAVFCLK